KARRLPRRHPPARARAPLDARHRRRGLAQDARHARRARGPPAALRGAGAPVSAARGGAAPLAAGLVVAAYTAALRRYGVFDPVDEGLLLVQALRTAHGQVPYVDFHTGYGPLYFRLQAWLLEAGGWDAIRWGLVAVHGAAGALLFVLARRLAGPALAWVAVALEVAFFLPVAPGRGSWRRVGSPWRRACSRRRSWRSPRSARAAASPTATRSGGWERSRPDSSRRSRSRSRRRSPPWARSGSPARSAPAWLGCMRSRSRGRREWQGRSGSPPSPRADGEPVRSWSRPRRRPPSPSPAEPQGRRRRSRRSALAPSGGCSRSCR